MEQFHLGFDIDTKPLANAKQAAQDAAAAIGKLGDAEQALGQKSGVAADQQKKFTEEVKRGAEALGAGGGGGGLNGGVNAAAGGFGRFSEVLSSAGLLLVASAAGMALLASRSWDVAKAVADQGDQFRLTEARLKNALGSTYAAQAAMESLYKSTQLTGTGFASASDSFLRLARNADALGATRSQIQVLSETVQKLGLVSGAGRGEIASGMIQLSQALASGRLNGDELRSIMENLPALAKAIAEGLGKSVGEMRAMGAAGELTGSKVFEAILKQSDKVNEEFKTLPNTAEREFQKVGDAWQMLLVEIERITNSSQFVQGIAKAAKAVIDAARDMAKAPTTPSERIADANERLSVINPMAISNLWSNDREKILAERAKAVADGVALLRTIENDTRADENRVLNKPITDASPIAKELDDRINKITKLNGQIKDLGRAIDYLGSLQTLSPDQTKQLDMFNRTLTIAKQELKDTSTPVEKLGRDFSKLSAAIAQGGGGGATALIQQAQKLADDMRKIGIDGGGSLDTLIRQEVMKGGDQLRNIEQQISATQRLTAATGANRDVVRELEIANEVATKRYQMFGDLKSPVIDGFFDRMTTALRAQKKAAEEANAANTIYANTLDEKIAGAQMYVIGNDYQQRRAAAELRAREADRRTPGVYQSEMNKFETGEDLSRARSTETLSRQFQLNQNRSALAGLSSEEYRVQLALLQKRAELEQQGVASDDARYASALRLVESIERQNIEFEKQRKQIEAIEGVIDNMGSSFRSTFVESMTSAFKTGKLDAHSFFQSIGDMAVRAGNEMVYEIAVRPIVMLLANAAKAGISQYFGTSAGMTGVNNSAGTATIPVNMAWNGAAFDKGVRAFALGGIVDKPTYFHSSGGTMNVAGEAGTEGIFPLKRGADGKLGVAAYGGGSGGDVQVIVNDMRTSKDSSAIETTSTTGANGMRQIQILVRDEIRRSMSAGEFDRTMQTNFGAQRQIARM